jgi:hypothetical protein
LQVITHAPLPLQLSPEAFGSDVVHALPQLPQFALSVCSLTHTLPQALKPMLHAIPQATPLQVAVPLPGTGHGESQLPPQLASDELFSQTPLQSWLVGGQKHQPPLHEALMGHVTPHLPQF